MFRVTIDFATGMDISRDAAQVMLVMPKHRALTRTVVGSRRSRDLELGVMCTPVPNQVRHLGAVYIGLDRGYHGFCIVLGPSRTRPQRGTWDRVDRRGQGQPVRSVFSHTFSSCSRTRYRSARGRVCRHRPTHFGCQRKLVFVPSTRHWKRILEKRKVNPLPRFFLPETRPS